MLRLDLLLGFQELFCDNFILPDMTLVLSVHIHANRNLTVPSAGWPTVVPCREYMNSIIINTAEFQVLVLDRLV